MRSCPTPTFWSEGRHPHLAVLPHSCHHPPVPYSMVCFPLSSFADPLTFGTHTGIVSHATAMSCTGSLSIGVPFFLYLYSGWLIAMSSPPPQPLDQLHFDGWQSHPLHAPTSRACCFAMPHQPWKHGAQAAMPCHHPAPHSSLLPWWTGCGWAKVGCNSCKLVMMTEQWHSGNDTAAMTQHGLQQCDQHGSDKCDDVSMAAMMWWEQDSGGGGRAR